MGRTREEPELPDGIIKARSGCGVRNAVEEELAVVAAAQPDLPKDIRGI